MARKKLELITLDDFKINGKHTELGRDTPNDAFKGFMLYELRDLKEERKEFKTEMKSDLRNLTNDIKTETTEIKKIFKSHCEENALIFKELTKEITDLKIFKANVYVIVTAVSICVSLVVAVVF